MAPKRLAPGIILLLSLVLLAACGVPVVTDSQAEIDAAVQATLTAVAVSPAADDNATPAPALAETPTPADVSGLVLPPQIPDFQPAPRPASTKGDIDAPLVMYEWSDFT